MTDQDETLAIARAFIGALNRGDRAGVKALLAEDVTRRESLEDKVISGSDAVVDDIWSYRNTFPDLHIEITDGFAAGDRAAVQLTATGTYEPYTYGPKAQKITWHGCAIQRVRDGKLVQLDLYVDWLKPIEQLGAFAYFPSPFTEAAQPGNDAKS